VSWLWNAVFVGTAGCTRPGSDTSPGDSRASDTEVTPGTTDTDLTHAGLPENPIVVFFSLDTLGQAAALDTGYCQRLSAILRPYGRSLACLDGAIAPASWTLESHLRVYWPQYNRSDLAASESPACTDRPMMSYLSAGLGGHYVFASDNAVLGKWGATTCPESDLTGWSIAADVAYEVPGAGPQPMDTPEDQRPDHFGIGSILYLAEGGGPVVGFLNAFEVGGHEPRCWYDPYSPSCEVLWDLAVQMGLAADDADRRQTFLDLDSDFQNGLVDAPEREDELRPAFWDSMLGAIEYYRTPLVEDRIERLISGLDAIGRADDLVLVVLGDHGENPCVRMPFRDAMNCAHTRIPTEWTANVPVMISPAGVAEAWASQGYVGDIDHPWSTVNLSRAVMDGYGVAIPDDWPAMEPVGAATSWSCNLAMPGAVRFVPGATLRCEAGQCGAFTWMPAPTPDWKFQPLPEVPPELVGAEATLPACAL
jgi:hypothetical protein